LASYNRAFDAAVPVRRIASPTVGVIKVRQELIEKMVAAD